MQDRVTELEVKLSFAEDLLDELNRTVFRQQQQIEQLHQEIRVLRQQMQANVPSAGWSLREEIPPHY